MIMMQVVFINIGSIECFYLYLRPDFLQNLETKILRCTQDNESSPSKHQQHEEAAQVLNRSCPPSSNTKVIDVTLNDATSLDSNLHESDNNQVNGVKLNEEKNKEMISNDESLGVEIVISHIKECNR